MTTDPHDYLRIMVAKKRPKNSFWKWPDRPVEERGIASEIFGQAGVDVADMRSREQGEDPPDCEAKLDGLCSGVEVTELIDRVALEQNLRQLESPEYFNWDKSTFLAALKERIDAKDRPWKGGPYDRRVLVIHTDDLNLIATSSAVFWKGLCSAPGSLPTLSSACPITGAPNLRADAVQFSA